MKLLIVLVILIGLLAVSAGVGYWYYTREFSDVDLVLPFLPGQDGEQGNEEAAYTGQYARDPAPDAVVAKVGDAELTNGELQVYYWAQLAACMEGDGTKPDTRLPLSVQRCPLAGGTHTWEQYFLDRALETWHGAQALTLQGQDEGLPLEERYQPVERFHEQYLQNKPATEFLYGFNPGYRTNTLHQNYIDALPDTMEALAKKLGYADGEAMAQSEFGTTLDALVKAASVYNYGYSYYTALTYLLEVDEDAVQAPEDGEPCVTFRQILLIPQQPKPNAKRPADEPDVEYNITSDGKVSCVETGWKNCEKTAKSLVQQFHATFLTSELYFGQMAYENSCDEGSKMDGGYYANVVKGILPDPVEEWLFADGRKPGEVKILRSEYGVHILYFVERSTLEKNAAVAAATEEQQRNLVESAKALYPMEVDYDAVSIQKAKGGVAYDQFLYADIGHERFPEVPLYLQRDYGNTKYGNYPLATHGCGITSMSMLGTYLTDEEFTPPTMCDLFGSYCGRHGTDVRLFWQVPSKLNLHFIRYTYNDDEAFQALEDGYPVIAHELKGIWTGGGHYIVCETLTEDGLVQVRDSNIFNYNKLEGHSVDKFPWDMITPQARCYFIFEKKTTTIKPCIRCGDPDEKMVAMIGDSYVCHKCETAMLRRDTYLMSN